MSKPLIEIKGLSGALAEAKQTLHNARANMGAMGSEARKLATTINDVTAQIVAAREEIEREAATLANAPASETFSESEENHDDK